MPFSNDYVLRRINAALKALTVGDLGSSKLVAEQADRFIRVVEKSTPLLQEARLYTMTTPERAIDRTGLGQRILGAPGESKKEKPSFNTNTLEAKEILGIVGIKDDTLEDNIEREDFEQTLLDMIAERAGIDMEELFIQGDDGDAWVGHGESPGEYLDLIDGWLKSADHKLTSANYDVEDIEDLFNEMLKTVPDKYVRNRSEWRFWVHWDMEDDYRNNLIARGTVLGDAAQTTQMDLTYKGVPIRVVSNMPEGFALLSHPDNTVYGIRRDIRIEPDRKPADRETDFVVTARVDADFENEEAVVAAKDYTG